MQPFSSLELLQNEKADKQVSGNSCSLLTTVHPWASYFVSLSPSFLFYYMEALKEIGHQNTL